MVSKVGVPKVKRYSFLEIFYLEDIVMCIFETFILRLFFKHIRNIFQNIFYLKINYAEQNGYLKTLIACVWGKGGREGGQLPSNHFRLLKRVLAL